MERKTIQELLKGIDCEFDKTCQTNPKAIKMIRHADTRPKLKKTVQKKRRNHF